ncbi:MAG TPA: helix-turn-helix domain-containing protein [Spirochaetota bacterium]|nr:helix-turn-helix domain-containing protein [Spirochaetota bacterium]
MLKFFTGPGRNFCLAMFLSVLIVSGGCFYFSSNDVASLSLKGEWEIIPHDASQCVSDLYDDPSARKIIIPGDWLYLLKQNQDLAATVWLRKTVNIPSSMAGDSLFLHLGEIGVADETYFNGQRIGATGTIPAEKGNLDYQQTWRFPRHYHIPASLVRYDSENVIAVRVFSHVFSGIKGEPVIIKENEGTAGRFFRNYSSIIINICSIALNLVFFSIFVMLLLANFRRVEYAYFAVILLLGVLLNVSFIGLPQVMKGLQKFKFIMLVYVFINYYIFIGMQRLFKTMYAVITYVVTTMLLFLTAGVVMAPTTSFLIFTCGFASLVYVNILIVLTLFVFIIALKRDPMRYWYLVFLVWVVPISFWRNIYYLFTMRFNEMGGYIFFHIPVLIYACMLYFFYDFEYARRNRESLYRSLVEKSQKLQKALSIAKKGEPRHEPREVINYLIEHLDSNYSERYNRKELAQKFSLNEDYMMQLFKKTTGVTISTYINNKRIEAVKDLLVDTEIKIIDIAYHVGFDNYTHFHRLFKKSTGLTPKEYRDYTRKAREV